MEEVVILLVDMEEILELVGYQVVFEGLVEIFLESPEDLADHEGCYPVIEPRGNEYIFLPFVKATIYLVLHKDYFTQR